MGYKSSILGIVLILSILPVGWAGQPTTNTTATGRLHLTFTEHSPLSTLDTVLRRMDMNNVAADFRKTLEYDLSKLSFEAVIPAGYKPDVAYGLLIWMGVADFPSAWLESMSRHKLILVVANTTRGHVPLYGPPLDIVYNMKKRYRIDENRVYASGFSAGGQFATMMLKAFPDVFRGGLFLMGGYFYLSRVDEIGRREPTVEQTVPAWKGPLDQIKKDVKIVIMKGGRDLEWTPQEGRSDYAALGLDGFVHLCLLEIPDYGHQPPEAEWFEKGIAALDKSQPLVPPVTGPTKEPQPQLTQIAQAKRILVTAQFYLEQKVPEKLRDDVKSKLRQSLRDTARKYLNQVLEDYPTTPAATKARELLQTMDQPSPGPAGR
jgi:hypothetical protein